MMFKMNRNSDPAGQVIPLLPGTETPHTDGCAVTEASGLYTIDLTMPMATTAADVNKCGVVRVKYMYYDWASTRENCLSSGFCEQQRCRTACAFVQSDQRLCYSLI